MDEFRKRLFQRMKELIPEQVKIVEVVSVDENNLSMEVKTLDDEISMYDIRLAPAMGNAATGIVIVPTVGCLALIGVIANIPSATYMINCQSADKIIFRGGSLGGLIKIEELKKQMQKDTDILKALLNIISGPTIPEPGNGSPSAFQASLKSAVASKQLGDYSSIENEKIKHG